MAYEAADVGLLNPELTAGIRRVKGVVRIGVRLGNWLTPEQSRRLLTSTMPSTARELRDQAMVAMVIGCGLRRAELLPYVSSPFSNAKSTASSRIWSGRADTSAPDPRVGEEARRRMDSRGGHHARPGVPRDQQRWPRLGRWHVAEGALGCRPRRCGSRGIDKLAAHDFRRTCPVSATSRVANSIRSSSCSDTSPSRQRSAILDASRSSGLR
jgi:integrase